MENRYLLRAAWISLIVSILLFATKLAAYYFTHSTAILSDALESIVNVLASGVALIVMRVVSQPADEEHPYGHGKLEYFSAAFEGGLIFFAALVIAVEAIKAFFKQEPPQQLDLGAALMVAAGLVNLVLSFYLKSVSKKYKSEALSASASHVLSDVWTTVAVVTGLAVVYLTGWIWLDALMALIVAVQLGYSGWSIVRRSAGALIDEKEDEVLVGLAEAIDKSRESGLIDIHQLRVIRSGSFHHVDAHLVIPEFWDIARAHEVALDFEKKIVAAYPYDGEIAFHLDPCEQLYCRICDLKECPIRKQDFIAHKEINQKSLVRGPDHA